MHRRHLRIAALLGAALMGAAAGAGPQAGAPKATSPKSASPKTGAPQAGAPAASQTAPAVPLKPPPEVEQALRDRVTQFYTLSKDGKFRQAESLVAEESRDLYYSLPKTAVREFKLESIEFDDSFQTAKVLMSVLALMKPQIAVSAVSVPHADKWKLLDGQWYLVLEQPKTTPFGDMHFDTSTPATGQQVPPSPVRGGMEILRRQVLRPQPASLVFPAQSKEPVTQTVVLTNMVNGSIDVSINNRPSPLLTWKLSSKSVPAKGEVALEVTYKPGTGRLNVPRAINIVITPFNRIVPIPIKFQ